MTDYKAMVDTLLTNYMNNYMETQQKATETKKRDLAVINAFNKNPRLYRDNEKMRIALAAKSYGVPIVEGALKDKPSVTQKAVALGGGAVDALLFGLLKNSWYSDDSTRGWADAGRIGGTAASLLMPWGAFGAGKGALSLLKIGKNINSLSKAKAAFEVANKAKLAQAAARLVYAGVNQNKFEPSLAEKQPAYMDMNKLKQFYDSYYGTQSMPGMQ